jgi:hypothetical protein
MQAPRQVTPLTTQAPGRRRPRVAPARLSRLALAGALALLAGAAVAAVPALDAPDLAQGPFSSMKMTLKKTILRINVANIDVRFDKATQAHFAALASGKSYSKDLAAELAKAAIDAGHAVVQMQFNHDVSLDRWMGVVKDNLEQARSAGLISKDLEQQVGQGLPQWFSPLKERGYEKGDRLLYEVRPDALHTAVVSKDGKVLLDRVDHEAGVRRVVLPSYFAPDSDFREPLLKSLFQ